MLFFYTYFAKCLYYVYVGDGFIFKLVFFASVFLAKNALYSSLMCLINIDINEAFNITDLV